MATIEKLQYGEFLRPSTAHAIGKINEIIDNLDGGGGGTEFATVNIDTETEDEYPITDKSYTELQEIAQAGKPVLVSINGERANWFECFEDIATSPDNDEEYNVVILRRFSDSFTMSYPYSNGIIFGQVFYFTDPYNNSWYRTRTYDIPALKDILPTVTISYDTESDPIVATVEGFPDPQLYPRYQAVLIKDTYINDVTLGNVIWDEAAPYDEPVQIVWGFSGIVNGSIVYNTMTLTLEAYNIVSGELVIETDTFEAPEEHVRVYHQALNSGDAGIPFTYEEITEFMNNEDNTVFYRYGSDCHTLAVYEISGNSVQLTFICPKFDWSGPTATFRRWNLIRISITDQNIKTFTATSTS